MANIELTPDELAIMANLFNQMTGVENVRVIAPIYDKVRAAMKAAEVGMDRPAARLDAPAPKPKRGRPRVSKNNGAGAVEHRAD